MSCITENTSCVDVPPGPSHNIIHPVAETETSETHGAPIDSLPCLEEFCQNTPVISKIYKMLETGPQDKEMLDFLESLESNNMNVDSQEQSQQEQQGSNSAENIDTSSSINCQTSDHDYVKTSNYCSQDSTMETSNNSNGGYLYGFVCEGTNTKSVYAELDPAPPSLEPLNGSLSQSLDDAIKGQSVGNTLDNSDLPPPQITISETEIDFAMQSVLNHLGGMSQKEVRERLDLSIIESCLENTVNRHFHVCGSCQSIFYALSTFQLHVQTCCDPPRSEIKSKMDQNAMDNLARGLWKEVFVSELKKLPNTAAMFKQLDHLHHELDQLWEMSSLDAMIWCRQIFIKLAVAIVSRRWVATAYANEAYHLRTRTLKGPPIKRAKTEPTEIIEEIPIQSSSEDTNGEGSRKNPKRRGRSKRQQKSETDVALEALLAENDDAFAGPSQQTIYTPETPVSEFGFDSGPASPVLSKRRPKTTRTSENNAEIDLDFDPEIDRIVREDDAVNDDAVAVAAQTIEGLDDRGNWENGQTGEPYQLGEDEYVVREILHRRLINENINYLPTEEDFEYLVAWEGYGDEENTWEPYDNLKHCSDKLRVFHERLRTKALRKRKGKRM